VDIKYNRLDIIALQDVLSEGKLLTGPKPKDISGEAKAPDYSRKGRMEESYGKI
jgi:hypothetical protein